MDDFDRRLVPPRADQTQSLGLPSHWFTNSLSRSTPVALSTQSVVTSIPNTSGFRPWEQQEPGPGSSGGVLPLGPVTTPFALPN